MRGSAEENEHALVIPETEPIRETVKAAGRQT